MFKLKMDTANAAFADDDAGLEIARILRELATKIEGRIGQRADDGKLADINGNLVGEWSYKP